MKGQADTFAVETLLFPYFVKRISGWVQVSGVREAGTDQCFKG